MDSDEHKIIDLYDRHAHNYVADRRSVSWNESSWVDRFSALLSQGASILDIGCGSGEPIARYLIDRGFAVDGVDTSPTLIDICRGRFPQRSWHVADMRVLALEDTFDGLLAWDSFFHLAHADQRRMFPIFRRHASPGAALMFTSGVSHGDAIGSYRGEPLYHASLAPEEYRALLKSQVFAASTWIKCSHSESDNFEQTAGAVINSWLLANSEAEAKARARREMMKIGWTPTIGLTVTRVHREDYEGNSPAIEYFDQAALDGIVIVTTPGIGSTDRRRGCLNGAARESASGPIAVGRFR